MPRSASSNSAKALDTFSVPRRPKGGGAAARLSAQLPAMQALSASDIAALSKAGGRWRPGLTDQPLHSEIFAGTADASGAGLALAFARDALEAAGQAADLTREPEDRRQVLWVQDRRAVQRSGRPYLHGLPAELRHRIIHVEAQSPEDALFALEEGLRCRDLACVIGEIVGNPRALDFTASRRLSLAAEKHGVALWLVRLEAEADLSSARMRWRVEAAPSAASRWNGSAPGTPAWHAELFRARSHAPGKWILSNEDGSGGAGRLSANRYGGYSATNGPVTKSPVTNSPVTSTQDSGPQNIIDLVRPTVGRSLAACGRG